MTDRHEHLDEGTIHAWLDGALTPDESARVESAAASCAECTALVAEARGLLPVASFQAAEALAKAGKPGPAAEAYANVAERFPDFASADLALLRAGDAAREGP